MYLLSALFFAIGVVYGQERPCAGSAGPGCAFPFSINILDEGVCSEGNVPGCYTIIACNTVGNVVESVEMTIYHDITCDNVLFPTQTIYPDVCTPNFDSCILSGTEGQMTQQQMQACCFGPAGDAVIDDFEEYLFGGKEGNEIVL
eukprot:UN02136